MAELEGRIKDGIWRPGDRLPTLQMLSHDLSVGTSTLREVLRTLEVRQIITIEQGRGMFVRTDVALFDAIPQEMTPYSLMELFEARLIIEPGLALLAAQRGFMEEIEEVGRLANRMSQLVDRHEDFREEDVAFHALIAKAAHNDALYEMFQAIETKMVMGRQYTNMIPGMIEKSAHYHLMIAESLSQRNSDQAKSLMKSHIEDMMSYILSVFQHVPRD